MLKCWKIGFWQNNEWIWVNKKCSQFWGNMFGRHTIINVKYSGNQRDMKYFCDLNIFGFISNHFWYLHFWTYCILTWFLRLFPEIRNCEISARRTDQDHHGIIDLTAFNTDGFDVDGKNVWIHDCTIWDQDDSIAVKVCRFWHLYLCIVLMHF